MTPLAMIHLAMMSPSAVIRFEALVLKLAITRQPQAVKPASGA
jgi:hypothetical protein